jgi:hypothetical protein
VISAVGIDSGRLTGRTSLLRQLPTMASSFISPSEEKFVGDPRRCVQRPIVRVTRHLESLIGACLISALIMH